MLNANRLKCHNEAEYGGTNLKTVSPTMVAKRQISDTIVPSIVIIFKAMFCAPENCQTIKIKIISNDFLNA